MRKAWATKNKKNKEKFFAAAWRSCGETMHLLADMTVPAHVRNDAHPVAIVFSGLRFDPYEHYVTSNNAKNGNIIEKYSKGLVDFEIGMGIESSKTAGALFHRVALYTNQNFFSADTLSGRNENGERVRSANGFRDYPSPSLNTSKVDALRVYHDNGTGYSVAHADWADNSWWNIDNYLKQAFAPKVSASARAIDSYEDVALDQAKILLPIALMANVKLLDMFIPEVEVKLTGFDEYPRVIVGEIEHIVSGVYADPALNPGTKPLVFSNCPSSYIRLTVNGRRCSSSLEEFSIKMANNKFSITLSDSIELNSDRDNIASLEMFFGGFWVKSAELGFSAAPKEDKNWIVASISGPIRIESWDKDPNTEKFKNYEGNVSASVKYSIRTTPGGIVKMKEDEEYPGQVLAEVVTDDVITVNIKVLRASVSRPIKIAGYELVRNKDGQKKITSATGDFSYKVGVNEDIGGAEIIVIFSIKGREYRNPDDLIGVLQLMSWDKRKPYYELD